jgi:hypothetical protein
MSVARESLERIEPRKPRENRWPLPLNVSRLEYPRGVSYVWQGKDLMKLKQGSDEVTRYGNSVGRDSDRIEEDARQREPGKLIEGAEIWLTRERIA